MSKQPVHLVRFCGHVNPDTAVCMDCSKGDRKSIERIAAILHLATVESVPVK